MRGEVRTTVNSFGIGTSFSKDNDYFISTVESPPRSRRYETLIKILGQSVVPIVVIVANNSKAATTNHIAMVRMAISTNRSDWSDKLVGEFRPIELTALMDTELSKLDSAALDSEYAKTLLKMSGINYPPPQSGLMKFIRKIFGG